jgi:Tol biopolymer transport system component/DNA-binding winged helix-turn-helix (wHTH) protein
MGSQPKPTSRIIFGPFEYDASSGELRKHRTKLRLTGQPLRILDVLLENPNQILSREELQQRLWNGTTFVDFEHGLNAAINKLRHTLGDSADQPRYVETLPGRGYRFIGALSYSSARPILEMVTATAGDPVNKEGIVEAKVADNPARLFWNRRVVWLVSGVVGLTLIAIAIFWVARFTGPRWSGLNPVAQTVRFRLAIPDGTKLSGSQTFSLSPDGRTLVYLARAPGRGLALWSQSLDSLEPRVLTPHLGGGDAPVFWSPDSKFVIFDSKDKLKKIDFSGNPPQDIGPVPGIVLGGSWNREGTIIFGTETAGILRIEARGGEPLPVTTRSPARGERVHAFPIFLPDGRHFLYSRQSSVIENTGVFIGSIDAIPGEQSLTRLIATPFAAQFVASHDGNGVVLFQRETTLWAQDFDSARLQLRGEPRKVAEYLGATRAFGFFSSSNGVVVHRNAPAGGEQLTWFDRRGRRLAPVGQPFDLFDLSPEISPDGKRVAVTKFDGSNVDVWVHDLDRDVTQRITFDPSIDQLPIWSPDGKRITFSSSRAGHYDLYEIGAGGEGREELLWASSENKFATSWSADGRFVLYATESGHIWVLPMQGTGKHTPVQLTHTRANERSGVFSPDSRWIAYVSDESGTAEVYVRPFSFPPEHPDGGPKVLLSRRGGSMPHWRADGKEIFYRSPDGTLMSTALTTIDTLRPGVPQSFFHLAGAGWDVTGDGNRFLVGLPVDQGEPSFTVVLNWQSEWKK